jgi:hypothetical protein
MSATAAVFNRQQRPWMNAMFIILFVLWEYSNLSAPSSNSNAMFDPMSRTLDVQQMYSAKTAAATTDSIGMMLSPERQQAVDTPTSSLFSTWKSSVKDTLRHQIKEMEMKEHRNAKINRTQARYEELLQRLETVDDWSKNSSSWTTVSPGAFQDTVQHAQAEIKPLINQVHSDCIVWIVPFKARTGQRGVFKVKPKIQFQCDTHHATRKLQDKPCSDANLCWVQTDLKRWDYNESQIPYNTSLPNIDFNDNSNSNKSALLTMVDSTEYLHGSRIWSCFLNKASFSFFTKRPFFIWIGQLDAQRLHQRNTDIVQRNFGASCVPFSQDMNAVNYFKPIAFAALFHRQQFVHVDTAYFLDADIYFNTHAEFSERRKYHLEDYFALSPQASLLGSQNPSGKNNNILINGGFLGLRRGAWIDDFAALWWFCRCGEKDQTALWLTLFAYWSAFSYAEEQATFSYPAIIFENYDFARHAVVPHSQRHLANFHKNWHSMQQLSKDSAEATEMIMSTRQLQNTHLFDGGTGFFKTTESSSSDLITAPLELPNVLLLPLKSFQLKSEQSNTTNVYPTLISKLKDLGEEGALVIHNKFPHNTCADQLCWPFRT